MAQWIEIGKEGMSTIYGWDDGCWVEDEKGRRPYYEYKACVKWDGCTHLYAYSNGSEDDKEADYMHLCSDVEDFAAMMTALAPVAKRDI